MSPSAVDMPESRETLEALAAANAASSEKTTSQTVAELRKTLTSEASPLPIRFRALFSLKHVACKDKSADAEAAIDAIAAGFASPSALLKHELAYCLGQTGNLYAVEPLRAVLRDLKEDPMCRHEAAEALGALGDAGQLEILKEFRDREGEDVCIVETCEIAIDLIEWQNSEQRKLEKLQKRYGTHTTLAPQTRVFCFGKKGYHVLSMLYVR